MPPNARVGQRPAPRCYRAVRASEGLPRAQCLSPRGDFLARAEGRKAGWGVGVLPPLEVKIPDGRFPSSRKLSRRDRSLRLPLGGSHALISDTKEPAMSGLGCADSFIPTLGCRLSLCDFRCLGSVPAPERRHPTGFRIALDLSFKLCLSRLVVGVWILKYFLGEVMPLSGRDVGDTGSLYWTRHVGFLSAVGQNGLVRIHHCNPARQK